MIKEKKQALDDLKDAQKKEQLAQDARKIAEKKFSDGSGRVGEYMNEIEELKETIQEQMRVVQAAHKETDEVERKMEFYKSTVDLINEKFGGIDAVGDQIRIAKMKEQSVGNLWNKLDTCINSTEGHL